MDHENSAGNEGVNIRFLQKSVLGSVLFSMFRANHNKPQVMTEINKQEVEVSLLVVQARLDLLRRWVHLNNMHFTNVTCQGIHPGTKKGGLTYQTKQCVSEAADLHRRWRH